MSKPKQELTQLSEMEVWLGQDHLKTEGVRIIGRVTRLLAATLCNNPLQLCLAAQQFSKVTMELLLQDK